MRVKRKSTELLRVETVIFVVRGQRVILDSDLARVYGVTTTRLNQQVRRNRDKFPEDFMFSLTKAESDRLMLQNATSNMGRGGGRKLPLVFTEHGATMVANILRTKRAAQMSVFVVRAFVRLGQEIALQGVVAEKLKGLELEVGQARSTDSKNH